MSEEIRPKVKKEYKSLAEALPYEQKRCRELLCVYKEAGPAGIFGYTMINNCLEKTEKSIMSGDVASMINCYNELRGFQ